MVKRSLGMDRDRYSFREKSLNEFLEISVF